MQAGTSRNMTGTGYAGSGVTKPPNWHGLVAWDMLFNNMTTGLYLTAAVADLARPGMFGPLMRWAYPLALLFLTADLICLVLDLGDPKRFHHMLRVFKPSSPMSLGTWSLTAYSLPLTAVVAIDLLAPGEGFWSIVRTVAIAAGIVPALGSAVYKGVLFSTTSQPAWKDARWLGAYLTTSALAIGAGELLAIAVAVGDARAMVPLRIAFVVLWSLSMFPTGRLLVEMIPTIRVLAGRRGLIRETAWFVSLGFAMPAMSVAVDSRSFVFVGMACLLVESYRVRHAIVKIPHRFA